MNYKSLHFLGFTTMLVLNRGNIVTEINATEKAIKLFKEAQQEVNELKKIKELNSSTKNKIRQEIYHAISQGNIDYLREVDYQQYSLSERAYFLSTAIKSWHDAKSNSEEKNNVTNVIYFFRHEVQFGLVRIFIILSDEELAFLKKLNFVYSYDPIYHGGGF